LLRRSRRAARRAIHWTGYLVEEATMAQWSTVPHAGDYRFDAATVSSQWTRLHAGDAEPLPQQGELLDAWAMLHNGDFQGAVEAGLRAGGAGVTLANKAMCMYANYLEKREQARLDLFMQAAQRAQSQAAQEPGNPNAWYWQAYALGRYSQAISVAKALAQGLAGRIKEALERAIKLEPRHADAHIALGTFHAEVIDKVGPLVAGMTYGASKALGLQLFDDGLRLNPASPIAMIEYANGLLMLDGDARLGEATRLYEQAARCEPRDAVERLQVELARTELVE
jgi:tetratricopeptide (TPR) repeat protein